MSIDRVFNHCVQYLVNRGEIHSLYSTPLAVTIYNYKDFTKQ